MAIIMRPMEQERVDMSANLQVELQHTAADDGLGQWREGVLALPEPFSLESGAVLHGARLAWQCVGPAQAPLVIVLGGISAHRRACAADGRGWWQGQCGPGRALDTRQYRLLGVDWLGGVDASTGPHGATDFPAISTSDQARALLLLLNRLSVRRVHLLVGASYGGAVAQQLAALLGDRLRRLVLLSAAHRTSQFGLALRHIQRAILALGGDAGQALALARSLAVLGYRTPHGIEARFDNPAGAEDVLGWLAHHGERFAQRFDAAAYRCLGTSLDTHTLDPASIRVPTTLLSVREDLLVPPALLEEYAERAGATCRRVEISSIYGHDAFLKEEQAVGALLCDALEARA
jgi:homoserine O-acetyltransferase/O-succinyltransferase